MKTGVTTFTYLFQTELTISRVIGCQKGCTQLHDILQVDTFTSILLPIMDKLTSIISISLTLPETGKNSYILTQQRHQRPFQAFLPMHPPAPTLS